MKYERIQKTYVPSRVIVGVLGCLGCCLLYVLRSNLSVAIIAMVDEKQVIENNNESNNSQSMIDKDLCYDIHSVNKSDVISNYKVSVNLF